MLSNNLTRADDTPPKLGTAAASILQAPVHRHGHTRPKLSMTLQIQTRTSLSTLTVSSDVLSLYMALMLDAVGFYGLNFASAHAAQADYDNWAAGGTGGGGGSPPTTTTTTTTAPPTATATVRTQCSLCVPLAHLYISPIPSTTL